MTQNRSSTPLSPEELDLAQHFHETYEELAPSFGWETQERSRVPWSEVPQENKALMVAVIHELRIQGVLRLRRPWDS